MLKDSCSCSTSTSFNEVHVKELCHYSVKVYIINVNCDGNIFAIPVSLLPSIMKLNGNFFISPTNSALNSFPRQLIMAEVLVHPQAKFSAAALLWNSELTICVRWSDKLKMYCDERSSWPF